MNVKEDITLKSINSVDPGAFMVLGYWILYDRKRQIVSSDYFPHSHSSQETGSCFLVGNHCAQKVEPNHIATLISIPPHYFEWCSKF